MFSDPQFWVMIAFVLFIIAIFNPVRKMLNFSLDNKIQDIKNSINEAEKLKNETQVTLSEIKKRQTNLTDEIKIIDQQTSDKIKINERIYLDKLQQQIEKRKNLTEIKIDQMVREANKEIQEEITHIAITAAINLLEKKLDQKEKQNLIDKSVNELGTILKN